MAKQKTEAEEVQIPLVQWIRRYYPGTIIIANPFSEIQIHGSENYRKTVLMKAQAMGWRKETPDIILLKNNGQYCGLALELKRTGSDPLRIPRGKTKPWVQESTSKEAERVRGQAIALAELYAQGYLATFATGLDAAKFAVEQYFKQETGGHLSFFAISDSDSGPFQKTYLVPHLTPISR